MANQAPPPLLVQLAINLSEWVEKLSQTKGGYLVAMIWNSIVFTWGVVESIGSAVLFVLLLTLIEPVDWRAPMGVQRKLVQLVAWSVMVFMVLWPFYFVSAARVNARIRARLAQFPVVGLLVNKRQLRWPAIVGIFIRAARTVAPAVGVLGFEGLAGVVVVVVAFGSHSIYLIYRVAVIAMLMIASWIIWVAPCGYVRATMWACGSLGAMCLGALASGFIWYPCPVPGLPWPHPAAEAAMVRIWMAFGVVELMQYLCFCTLLWRDEGTLDIFADLMMLAEGTDGEVIKPTAAPAPEPEAAHVEGEPSGATAAVQPAESDNTSEVETKTLDAGLPAEAAPETTTTTTDTILCSIAAPAPPALPLCTALARALGNQ